MEIKVRKYIIAIIIILGIIGYLIKNLYCVNFVHTDKKYIISFSHLGAMTSSPIKLSEIRLLPEKCISLNSLYLNNVLKNVNLTTVNSQIMSYVLILKRVEDGKIFYFGYFSPKYNEMLIVDSQTDKKYILNHSQIKKLLHEIGKNTNDIRPKWWLNYEHN